MPADLLPSEAIPERAAQVDSPTVLRVLRRLCQAGSILNGRDVDRETAAALRRLTDLGLVDPGYDGRIDGKPLLWVSNPNAERVLRYVLESRLTINPRARTALDTLSPKDQLEVLEAAEALRGRDPASWPNENVVRLGPDEPMYLLRLPSDLRAFIRVVDSGGVELLDIMREETLRLFLERYRAGSKAG